MRTVDACVEDVLKRGLEDWVQAAEVASVARMTGGVATDASTLVLSLQIIREVVTGTLVTIGDVTRDGFKAWDLEADVALARVEQAWMALGRDPGLGEICWLSNTKAGDERARIVLESQAHQPEDE